MAALAGVSASTVSRALADSPLTAPKTRKRIQALAKQVGFSVNPAASMLRTRLTRTIGLVMPIGPETSQLLSDPFCSAMLTLIANDISSRGYDVLLKRVEPDHDNWLKAIIDSRRVDGVIILGQSDQDEVIDETARNYLPLVVWGQWRHEQAYTTVGVDNVGGGKLAAEHLIARGRGRLAYVGSTTVPEFRARYEGFLSGLSGRVDAPDVIVPHHHTIEDSYAAAVEYLKTYPTPDGVFAGSDVVATGVIRALREYGSLVPDDVAIVGFDDVDLALHSNPPLTTIRQDLNTGAKMLCELLFQKLAGEACNSVLLPPQLIVRAST